MNPQRLDPSTGKPPIVWEDTPKIAAKHGDKYADRIGEIVTMYVLADGLTSWGRVLRPGEVVEVVIGSPEFWETCSPLDGASWIFLDGDSQLQRWRKVLFTHHAPPEAAETASADEVLEAARQRHRERMQARERAGLEQAWSDEAEIEKTPYRSESRHVDYRDT